MSKSPSKSKAAANHSPRVTNRRAYHDYHISDKLECGIALLGSEVKAIRAGRATLDQSFAMVEDAGSSLYLYNLDIGAYDHAAADRQHEPQRRRKLLAKKRQILELLGRTSTKGISLVPLSLYFNERGLVKIELGVGEGKRQSDKRQTIKKNESDRAIRRAMTRRVIN